MGILCFSSLFFDLEKSANRFDTVAGKILGTVKLPVRSNRESNI